MATLEFTKMHGCGNDYIYVVAMRARPADPIYKDMQFEGATDLQDNHY